MTEFEIFIHVEGEPEPRSVKVLEEILVAEILEQFAPGHHDEHVLIVEDIVLEPTHRIHHHAKHHHHLHFRRKVEIKVDGKKCYTHRGRNSVKHIRAIGKPLHEILSEYRNGEYIDLDENGWVDICGGEIFASHVKSGGSS